MKTFWIILIIIGLVVAGFAGWYFLVKKSAEGGMCRSDSRCQLELKCLNDKCSSGKNGSSCGQKSDCASGFCVKNMCTEGKVGNACATYNDCTSGLICKKSACAVQPDYSQYFSKITISKIKPGLPPGPDNPMTITDTFSLADSIEVDLTGIKSTTTGDFYFELIDPTTGEAVLTNEKQTLNGHDTQGTGTSLSMVAPGTYDFNFYLNNEFLYTTQIVVTK